MESMSRSIRSFADERRKDAVLRRLRNKTKGLGFWAAMDAATKHYPKDEKITEAVPKRAT